MYLCRGSIKVKLHKYWLYIQIDGKIKVKTFAIGQGLTALIIQSYLKLKMRKSLDDKIFIRVGWVRISDKSLKIEFES